MSRVLGPNMKRLMAYAAAKESISPGGGMADALQAIATPGRLVEITRNALAFADAAVAVMRTAPDNPYGEDEEAIAGAILAELDKRR
jgi:hypothetical protein